jgi:AraC-like DNA-binding protein
MTDVTEEAVARAIRVMRENLGEQLTVDDMARAALFSKFHFTRIFQRKTGVSPGRFLSALRLQQAKRLLVSTTLNVADISLRVGYNSVGTFSSRFTRSVGLCPTEYRRRGGYVPRIARDTELAGIGRGAVVHGRVWPAPLERQGLVFLGLFPDRVPEGRPVQCAILDRPGPYQLHDVPPGTWHLLAHSAAYDSTAEFHATTDSPEYTVSVASHGPITIHPDTRYRAVDVELHPACLLDPPVLLALVDARRAAFARQAEEHAQRSAFARAA